MTSLCRFDSVFTTSHLYRVAIDVTLMDTRSLDLVMTLSLSSLSLSLSSLSLSLQTLPKTPSPSSIPCFKSPLSLGLKGLVFGFRGLGLDTLSKQHSLCQDSSVCKIWF